MKKLEFETSKGRFVLVEKKQDGFIDYACKYDFVYLKQITEEQASEIVTYRGLPFKAYQDYTNDYNWLYSSIESLHSLLKSKGINLFENPFKNTYSIQSLEGSQKHSKQIQEAETKTFYNPVIFKL